MKKYKIYNNLYCLYRRSMNKCKIPLFVCLIIFVLAFATFFIDNFPFGLSLIMMGMIFPAMLFSILYPIFYARTRKFLKLFSPQQLSMINNEISSSAMCEGLIVTSQAVISTKVGGLYLVPMANMLWIYTSVTRFKLNFIIPIHKDTTLVFAGRDRKRYQFNIKNKGNAAQFIQSELLRHRLDLVFGYENGMDQIYKHDLNRLIAFSQECAEKRQTQLQGGQPL